MPLPSARPCPAGLFLVFWPELNDMCQQFREAQSTVESWRSLAGEIDRDQQNVGEGISSVSSRNRRAKRVSKLSRRTASPSRRTREPLFIFSLSFCAFLDQRPFDFAMLPWCNVIMITKCNIRLRSVILDFTAWPLDAETTAELDINAADNAISAIYKVMEKHSGQLNMPQTINQVCFCPREGPFGTRQCFC